MNLVGYWSGTEHGIVHPRQREDKGAALRIPKFRLEWAPKQAALRHPGRIRPDAHPPLPRLLHLSGSRLR